MPHARTSLAALATAILVGSAGAQQPPRTGSVNGALEDTFLTPSVLVLRSNADSLVDLATLGPDEQLTEEQAARLETQIAGAVDIVAATRDGLEDADPSQFEVSTDARGAGRHLEIAADGQIRILNLFHAEKYRQAAAALAASKKRFVQCDLALLGEPQSAGAATAHFDYIVDTLNFPNGTGPGFPAATPFNAVPRQFVFGDVSRGRFQILKGGAFRNGKTKPSAGRYLGFRATKGTASGGFAVMQRKRDAIGPYQARITAGSFTTDEKRRAELGSAFACFEFDVKGSSPLEFLSVCARPTDGGVQVFASTRAGNLGQAFLAGTDLAVLDVEYDGTTFRCRAKKPGEADSALAQFASFTRPQGTDVWTVGIGGAGLGGRAEVGVDDFAIWAITR